MAVTPDTLDHHGLTREAALEHVVRRHPSPSMGPASPDTINRTNDALRLMNIAGDGVQLTQLKAGNPKADLSSWSDVLAGKVHAAALAFSATVHLAMRLSAAFSLTLPPWVAELQNAVDGVLFPATEPTRAPAAAVPKGE